jgi:hypothetical protein
MTTTPVWGYHTKAASPLETTTYLVEHGVAEADAKDAVRTVLKGLYGTSKMLPLVEATQITYWVTKVGRHTLTIAPVVYVKDDDGPSWPDHSACVDTCVYGGREGSYCATGIPA